MEDLKFISSKTRSKLFSLKREGRFSGFFSVTTFFTSVFNNNLTAIKTSGSSSITSTDVFFKFIFPVHFIIETKFYCVFAMYVKREVKKYSSLRHIYFYMCIYNVIQEN